MSDSDDDKAAEQRDEAEVREEIQTKCLKAFQSFDIDGTGEIQSGEVKLVIEMMGISMND